MEWRLQSAPEIFLNLKKRRLLLVQVFRQGQDLGEGGEDSEIPTLNASFLPRVFRIHSLLHRSERLKITAPPEPSPWTGFFPGIL